MAWFDGDRNSSEEEAVNNNIFHLDRSICTTRYMVILVKSREQAAQSLSALGMPLAATATDSMLYFGTYPDSAPGLICSSTTQS